MPPTISQIIQRSIACPLCLGTVSVYSGVDGGDFDSASIELWSAATGRRTPKGLVAEDHIGGQAELIQVAAAADDAELGTDAELHEVVHLDARAEGHGQLV